MSEAARLSLREKMFSFHGRLRRRDFWLISICLGVPIFLLTEAAMWTLFGPQYSFFGGHMVAASRLRVREGWPYLVQLLLSSLTIWPNLAMSAKRAHDRDKTASLVLVLTAVVWLDTFAQILLTNLTDGPVGFASSISLFAWRALMSGASLYLLVAVGCLDGTAGRNRFGPSPKLHERPVTPSLL